MVFPMFLAFLIFDPNWPFCKGYSLCIGDSFGRLADFQNRLISGILGVFSNGSLHRTTLMFFKNGFSHGLAFLIFDPNWPFCNILHFLEWFLHMFLAFLLLDPKWPFCKGYSLCIGYRRFFERFLAQNNSNVLVEWFFAWFWPF